ncbi:hypothetical protein BHE74_00003647 [Ensete ventricosum]|nr:hypothetical protein BHE74_00003647 [Ensete ventricosum]RZR76390.1 hypothetical protein BHM03_00001124 [Ensete ventricosum]
MEAADLVPFLDADRVSAPRFMTSSGMRSYRGLLLFRRWGKVQESDRETAGRVFAAATVRMSPDDGQTLLDCAQFDLVPSRSPSPSVPLNMKSMMHGVAGVWEHLKEERGLYLLYRSLRSCHRRVTPNKNNVVASEVWNLAVAVDGAIHLLHVVCTMPDSHYHRPHCKFTPKTLLAVL